MENRFCSITAGVNTCHLCFEKAFYSLKLPQRPHRKLPRMELFRCGHGMCASCYEAHTRAAGCFKCPWCRDGCSYIFPSFPHSAAGPPKSSIATLSELVDEWSESLDLLYTTRSPFILLHKQIFEKEKNRQVLCRDLRVQAAKEAAKREEKKKRAAEREKAVCGVCGKATFTSAKQLEAHTRAKHQ
ncbi:hypothetical protein ElyMa_002586300 [Elysia marginata]|uniref:RING-type domain-containing protein n=1 Tax=Elysia marginata TaxID=1093978 RepID=A0AAV4H107_9GAST|nr:hypothetical protein ElyMa_002586300 [Elysia marginata]